MVEPTALKIMMEFVSWDDEIPNISIYGKIEFMFQTTDQHPIMLSIGVLTIAKEKWVGV